MTDLFDKSRSHPSAENGASVLEQVIALQFAFVLSVCNSYSVTRLMTDGLPEIANIQLKTKLGRYKGFSGSIHKRIGATSTFPSGAIGVLK